MTKRLSTDNDFSRRSARQEELYLLGPEAIADVPRENEGEGDPDAGPQGGVTGGNGLVRLVRVQVEPEGDDHEDAEKDDTRVTECSTIIGTSAGGRAGKRTVGLGHVFTPVSVWSPEKNKKTLRQHSAVKVSLIKSKLDGNARPLGHAVDVTPGLKNPATPLYVEKKIRGGPHPVKGPRPISNAFYHPGRALEARGGSIRHDEIAGILAVELVGKVFRNG